MQIRHALGEKSMAGKKKKERHGTYATMQMQARAGSIHLDTYDLVL
jgi:hypothetical protein